jgi:dephospho-CoA kinase
MLRSCMNTSNKPSVIGLAGTFASGKDTVSHYLAEFHGFTHVSTSEMVREVAMKERGSVERPILHEVADEHRRSDGAGWLVEVALKKERPLVISGLRSLGEAKTIKQAGGVLVFIDAPIESRYERMKARSRDREILLSLEEFRDNELKEWHIGDSDADFNLRDIKKTSDVVIENTSTVDELVMMLGNKLGLSK